MKRQCSSLTKERPPRKKLENLNRGRDEPPAHPIDSFVVRGSKIAIGRWGPSPLPRFKREHSTAPSLCNFPSTAAEQSPRDDSQWRTRVSRAHRPAGSEVTRLLNVFGLILRLKDLTGRHFHQPAVDRNKIQSLT